MIRFCALLVFASPVAAQEFTVDSQWIDQCRAAQENPMVCVGRAAQTCAEAYGAGPDMVHAACFEAEAAYWDRALNEAYGDLRQLATDRQSWDVGYQPDALATALRDMQRAWIGYRDATCANAVAIAAPFGSAAGPAGAECRVVQTARQYLVLRGMRQDYLE